MAGGRLGKAAKFYYDTSGVSGATWLELTIVRSVTRNQARKTAAVDDRSRDEEGQLIGSKQRSLDVELTYDPTDAGYEAFRDAYENGSLIGVAAADGAIATIGTEHLQMDAYVSAFNYNEPLEESMSVTVTLVPAEGGTAPVHAETAV